ncbi:MAG: methyltransferase domain-containing protein [Phycisphaerales bacterium]|nr:MAG: methyltransferase domain-containing protein [Phycisphaerales bacterium]
MSDPQQIRDHVAQTYARAGCATSSRPLSRPEPSHIVSRLAGYTPDELEALPPAAVLNSYGCGHPLAFSEVQAGEVVLDLGCGAGLDLLLAGRMVGPAGRVIGVDMTEQLLERARVNIAEAGLINVEVRKGIIEELPVENESVDWVISNCVINLSPEKHRVFAEIARVLRPGGRMLVSDIVVEALPAWARESEALYGSCVAGAISEKEYVNELRQAGLTDVRIRNRIVYDEGQLGEFLGGELSESSGVCSCGANRTAVGGPADDLARQLVGKIWSAKIFACKPASACP